MINRIKINIVFFIGFIYFFFLKVFVGRRYKDEAVTSDKLNSVLIISEVDKKGGAAKLAYGIHNFLLSKNIESNMLVGMVTEPEENIYLLRQRDDKLSRILYKYDSIYHKYDLMRLSSFDILKMDIFKKATLVHLHNLHVNYFSKFVLPKMSAEKKVVWTLHDTLDLFESYPDNYSSTGELKTYPNLDEKQRESLRNLSQRLINNSYLTVVVPSKWLYDKAKRGVFKNVDLRLIYNGVNEEVFKPRDHKDIRRELGLPINNKILLFSAAWGLSDGTKDSRSTLIRMTQHLKARKDITFVILGGNSTDFGDNSINIPYIREDELLSKYYSAADLFIYPSLWDNCPLSVLENMATGTPIITFNTGGIPELVKHMETGYVARYNDVDDFIVGVDMFIDDSNLLKSASNLSREILESQFTYSKMADQYFQLYNDILYR